jgi:hypothetical protein
MQPKERRVNINPHSFQWVIDFTIYDQINAKELDELLNTMSLTFVYYDDATSDVVKTTTLEDYVTINTASISYGPDLNCNAHIQLGKEIESYDIKV